MERILVADDERAVAQVMQKALEAQGHHVECVYDGREALARLEQEDFDRAYVDVMMPYVDGFEVLRWIRRHPTKSGTWVALMTAMADVTNEAQRDEIRPGRFIMKPLNLADLD